MSANVSEQKTGVKWRAVLISLILMPLNSYWIIQMESVYYSGHSTATSLFFNVVFSVLVLIILDIPLKKLSPNLAFSQSEYLTVYIMLSQASALAGHSMMQILPPAVVAPYGLATPENEWNELFGRYIPEWLAVSDEKALHEFIKGESTLYTAWHIGAWLLPVIVWSAFICVLMFVMICINIIIRRQWIDRERLTYPIVQLPYEMTDRKSRLFKSKLMWISFIFVGVIDTINGLHFFSPAVPYLHLRPFDLGAFFNSRPWNALGYTPLAFRPYLMGIIFLIPLDIIFSCWFFFFFWKAQLVVGSALGFQQRPEFPEQSAGAYVSLFFIALWIGRRHLWRSFRSLLSMGKGNGLQAEYKYAVTGLICGLAFILIFCWKMGMSIWAASIFFILYLMTNIGVTRIRAEVGSPVHDLHFAGPEILMVDAFGTQKIGPGSLSIISFFWFLTRAHYSDPMPHQLEAFKLADRARMKGVIIPILIATAAGTLTAFWVILDTGYRRGGLILSWAAWEPFSRLQNWLTHPKSPDITGIAFFAYGLLFGIFLMFMRMRFIWWSFHPAGYAVSSTYGMRDCWSMFFLIWLVKRILLKYGGLKAHRQSFPLFFGMILGEFAIGGLWTIIGVILKTRIYSFTAWW